MSITDQTSQSAWDIIELHFKGGVDAITKGVAVRRLMELGYSENFASNWIDEVWQERFGKKPTYTFTVNEDQYTQLMFILESAESHSTLSDDEKEEAWSLLTHIQDEVAEDMQIFRQD